MISSLEGKDTEMNVGCDSTALQSPVEVSVDRPARFDEMVAMPIARFVERLRRADLTVDGYIQVLREMDFDARHIVYYLMQCMNQNQDRRVKLKAVGLMVELLGAGKTGLHKGGINLNQLFISSPQELERLVREGAERILPIQVGVSDEQGKSPEAG